MSLIKSWISVYVICRVSLLLLTRPVSGEESGRGYLLLGADGSVQFDYELSSPQAGYTRIFPFVTYQRDVEDGMALHRQAFHFCEGVLQQLPMPWSHFYLAPNQCQEDIVAFARYGASFAGQPPHAGAHLLPGPMRSATSCRYNWLWTLQEHERSASSQGGQDGVLERIFSEHGIGETNKYYVEIGFNSDAHDGGTGSNTFELHRRGWSGLLLDTDNQNPAINLWRHTVTAENVVSILEGHLVPIEPDYMSIDIDSQDLWVLRSVVSSGRYRPRVISVEFNPNLPIGSLLTVAPGSKLPYSKDILYGAAAGAIKAVAEEFGYVVVHIVSFLDVILIRSDLIQGLCPVPFYTYYTKRGQTHHCIKESERMNQWVDYGVWRASGGDVEMARAAAVEGMLLGGHGTSPSGDVLMAQMACFGADVDVAKLRAHYEDSTLPE